MKRGVITSPASFKLDGSRGFSVSSGIDSDLMKYYLMYWDEIIIPQNNLIHVSSEAVEQALTLGNVYNPSSRLTGKYKGHEIAHAIAQEQLELAALFKKHPTMDWVLHQYHSNNVLMPEQSSIERDSIRMTLTDLLPVPSEDVPFQEILEFKLRRNDELTELHTIVDNLLIEYLRSPDQGFASSSAVSALTNAVDNLDRVTSERFQFFKKFSFEPSFNIKGDRLFGYPAVATFVESAISGDTFNSGLPLELSFSLQTALGLAIGFASGFECKVTRKKVPKAIEDKLHLSYLVNARNERILSF